MPTRPTEADHVFNIVITPGTFRYLGWFTRSLLDQSAVRIRLVANGCSRDDVRLMDAFADARAGRVETDVLATPTMVAHGTALDTIYDAHADGDAFCFVDSDVAATRPFMPTFLELTPRYAVVTSGNVAWSDDTVLPPGARELVGRHAVGPDGFVYGSSYLAIYTRRAVDRVRERWGVSFRAGAHDQLPEPARARLAEMGRRFELYDTAKVVNILVQDEGFAVTHVDNPALVHIGGISQFLADAPVSPLVLQGAGRERAEFARWAAATLRGLVDGGDLPPLPDPAEARSRAELVQRELLDLARRYR